MRRSRSKLILAGVLTALTAITAGAYGQPVRQEWQPAHEQCAGLLRADLDGSKLLLDLRASCLRVAPEPQRVGISDS